MKIINVSATFTKAKMEMYNMCFPHRKNKIFFHKNILYDYKCIYIHIPKTGGTSINNALHNLPKKNRLEDFNPVRLNYSKHASALEMKHAVGDEIWEEYFTFAFVRNPWDIMVSSYNWWLQKAPKWKHLHHDVKNIEHLGSFERFMHSKYGRKMINEFKGNMFNWLSENDEVIVDFVGKFENIQEDWNRICERLCVEPYKLPYLNQTERKHYKEYYTQETKQIVHERFKKIIEIYDYEF